MTMKGTGIRPLPESAGNIYKRRRYFLSPIKLEITERTLKEETYLLPYSKEKKMFGFFEKKMGCSRKRITARTHPQARVLRLALLVPVSRGQGCSFILALMPSAEFKPIAEVVNQAMFCSPVPFIKMV
ncbi:hypothetical protein AVEN_148197-1 [Araneus ventricosus]|uniref:Uncharacterized protein n=1 Tax=Araneus ventricosus TaxID=182803 RepID=A0A4Y2DDP0_ARAVE|nr:hypothetical protein AVEN_148197-1 [Araneus ventricosus]